MENKIIENNKNGDNDFFEITCNEEEMAKKYQKFYDYLVTDENGIRHDLDKLKKNYDKNTRLLTCSIFAVNFWHKKQKENKIDNNKTDEKANEIKHMMKMLNYDIKFYNPKTELNEYDCNIQKQIDMVNSIEKIFGAFMSIDLKLFKIKKFDDFMSMSNEDHAEFYNVIWAAGCFSALNLIDQYRIFLNNNKVLDEETAQNGTDRNLWKINLALNESDLKKIETKMKDISKLQNYNLVLDNCFKRKFYEASVASLSLLKVESLQDLLKLSADQLNEYVRKYRNQNEKSIIKICSWVAKMKDGTDNISNIIGNLKKHPEQEIKNNLEEKILWNNKCTSEKREDFFKINSTFDKMREKYKCHMEYVFKNGELAKLNQAKSDVVNRFTNVCPDLKLPETEKIKKELEKKYKDISVVMYTVNFFNQKDNKDNKDKIDEKSKIDESVDIMNALEIDESATFGDSTKAAYNIEKIFFAFMNVDISKFNIEKFDSFMNMESETYMKFIEIVTAAAHAYKFIEKYQEFLDKNEKIDRDIEELRELKLPCRFYETKEDILK